MKPEFKLQYYQKKKKKTKKKKKQQLASAFAFNAT
jgi:hypothetical protein